MKAEYLGSGSDGLRVKAKTVVAAYWAACGHCGEELWSTTTGSFMVPADELTSKEPFVCIDCGAANFSGRPLQERQ